MMDSPVKNNLLGDWTVVEAVRRWVVVEYRIHPLLNTPPKNTLHHGDTDTEHSNTSIYCSGPSVGPESLSALSSVRARRFKAQIQILS